jgi:hypothetical protein
MNNDIINLFGNELARLIQKPPVACKGLIRFSLADFFKQKQIDEISIGYDQFLFILEQIILTRLKSVNIQNAIEVVEKMRRLVIKNQALFTIHQ